MIRRHELDWLRVLLFALLVPFHVAIGFVDWGGSIYRFANDDLAGDGMKLFIYWSHGWRLASLFLIAGIGSWFWTRTMSSGVMGVRLLRLLVPALFASAFLNVISGYVMARMGGFPAGFFTFWWLWLTAPDPRHIQHLWFLLNLAIYTLLCWPIFAWRDRIERLNVPAPALLGGLVAVSVLAVLLLKPYAAASLGNNYQFVLYLIFFIGGFLIGAKQQLVLAWVGHQSWRLIFLAAALFIAKASLFALALLEDVKTGRALAFGGWIPAGLQPENAAVFSMIEAMNAWAWCLGALGLCVRYLNKPSPILAELNRAVFPVYVLHFPVVLLGLGMAMELSWPWQVEFLMVTGLTYCVSWMLWRAFDRLGVAAYLVGGDPGKKTGRAATSATKA